MSANSKSKTRLTQVDIGLVGATVVRAGAKLINPQTFERDPNERTYEF
jgi:hypothetical protein